MEKLGFQNCMKSFDESGLTSDVLATDRHVRIRKVLRAEFPDVDHEFDIWHLTKSVSKKLTTKTTFKECEELGPWINSVKNHLWRCAQNCNGNYEVLLEMWTSIVHHVNNVYHWNSAQYFYRCAHDQLSENDARSEKWIAPGSKAHKARSEVVFDKRLTKDLHVCYMCYTGSLEVFHCILLKYCPKRLHFSYPAMQARLQLAVLDHNNVGREQVVVTKENTKLDPECQNDGGIRIPEQPSNGCLDR
ncbi:hypothetical protein HOLleu_00198 [Holothuria leucospilota]|uniref:Uncharacterized protein n=1 Tax=Holothuria leucospilota TaxID=206669 RepID=A0A9Q1CP21_HOLLE|nr:hypothetical protein HOLleu_00198 [Holothuria leucospilota]